MGKLKSLAGPLQGHYNHLCDNNGALCSEPQSTSVSLYLSIALGRGMGTC